ncbi:MAG: DUF2442 domain-containing protein [Thiohalophilus sp.]
MLSKLKQAKYQGDYRIWLSFADGVEGEIDLSGELWGEMFEPLNDKEQFSQFELNAELGTITWPNGADFAPEFLYQKLRPDYKLKSTHQTGTA